MSAKVTSTTVRADFNDSVAVVHYARAAHFLGLWSSEKVLLERWFPGLDCPLLEAGCGAGRVAVGLAELGYRRITAFDFAAELVEQARDLVQARGAVGVDVYEADATRAADSRELLKNAPYAGLIFSFNGLMQIPGRENRRAAMNQLRRLLQPGAPFLFTTHDRDISPAERASWRLEARRWKRGEQDPRLVEFGDRYFEEEEVGRTFMHLPDRAEILEDLAATGWRHEWDGLRRTVAKESRAVRDFSDECRFWVARA
ncbi:MAG: class I SAM-dependent methyltransferase [Opitutaceae bacterium]|nr:class I SAM-dependent methyltransferase [Opitutaceae bacterium]